MYDEPTGTGKTTAPMDMGYGRCLQLVPIEQVVEAKLAQVKPLMIDIMTNAFKLDVPLKVDASTGYNWLELKG